MLILIDNYDSFTFNLVQYFGVLGQDLAIHRNDKISVDEVLAAAPSGIVISPGPCDPAQAGICLELVEKVANTDIPLLGVCLGHQTIGQAFGGRVIKAPHPMHGKVSEITTTGHGLFKDIPSPISVTRYHSLIVERETLPDCLEITAETEDGIIMAIQHKNKQIHGVQFHPESIATESGSNMLNNFVKQL